MKASRGFTLVEVLVALTIMAVLATMAWQGIDSIARSRSVAHDRLEQTLRLNAVLAQWEHDLQHVYAEGSAAPALHFDGSTMRIVRRAEGGVQVVAWSLRGREWLRWASPVVKNADALQDHWLRSQQLLGNEPGQVSTLKNLQGWQMHYHRGGAWSNAQSSAGVETPVPGSTPPPAGTPPITPGAAGQPPLPDGVRLMLTLPEGQLVREIIMGPA